MNQPPCSHPCIHSCKEKKETSLPPIFLEKSRRIQSIESFLIFRFTFPRSVFLFHFLSSLHLAPLIFFLENGSAIHALNQKKTKKKKQSCVQFLLKKIIYLDLMLAPSKRTLFSKREFFSVKEGLVCFDVVGSLVGFLGRTLVC